MKIRWFGFIFVLCLTSCVNKHSKVGKYVYVDCYNTIHTDRECAANLVDDPKTKIERMANMQGVIFIDTCFLSRDGWREIGVFRAAPYQYCPKCIDDVAFQRITAIMNNHIIKPPAY